MSARFRMSSSSSLAASFTMEQADDVSTTIQEDQTLLSGAQSELNQAIPCKDIQVEAPSDLPGGYQMETEVNGRPILVTIPKGGVIEGELFTPAAATELTDIFLSQRGPKGDASGLPMGHWRDGFWRICAHGPCHVTLWNSVCCPLLAAGQVITRLQLTWYGAPAANIAQVSVAFQTIVMILFAYYSVRAVLFFIYAYLDPNANPKEQLYIEPPSSYFFFTALDDLLFYMHVAFLVVVLRNIRSHMRARFSIPDSENVCCPHSGCEDVCCSLICPCFTVSQMLRHTADYRDQHGVCCNSTGLVQESPATFVKDAPSIV
ncbi:expressed unknown protein [Seminavis robusta]|uniref:Uncharacterized protein n=1 Tax=Seminavis robusta TaxID=568900 RepID=A0A9N8ECJ5_9STRA|nr:expressed unknown protein [Seminavis robusta]|eukprot:Sro880_g215030.1 n/a (318) ;mRNA; r:20679-22133